MIEERWGLPGARRRTPDRLSPSVTTPSRTAPQTGARRATIQLWAARRWPPKRCRIISAANRMQHRLVAGAASNCPPAGPVVVASSDVNNGSDPKSDRSSVPGGPEGVEYLVRAARVMDIDRLVALSTAGLAVHRVPARSRQRIFSASSCICSRRALSLRRRNASWSEERFSLSGHQSGPAASSARWTSSSSTRSTTWIASPLPSRGGVRSASNKGCTVEALGSDDPAESARWEALGFHAAEPRIDEPWPRRDPPRAAPISTPPCSEPRRRR